MKKITGDMTGEHGRGGMLLNDSDIAEFKKHGVIVLRRGDENYPKRLENLSNPPDILYCRGNLDLLNRPAVSIVGTRNCTRYGVEVAQKFARAFAGAGLAVVSGLADGIDTAAHVGAGEKNTIAVLGNGIDVYYPMGNEDLQKSIAENGLLISEYLPHYRGHKLSFPQRNRIVAALSGALLIAEADIKSGTMITKDFALDLGIDVFAVPGQINNPSSRGTNDLIKAGIAQIALEPADILSVFSLYHKQSNAFLSTKPVGEPFLQISMEEQQILDILGRDDVHIDELVEKTGLVVRKLAVVLTNMEMRGLLRKLPGNFYARHE